MQRTLIKDLHESVGKEVSIQGWVDVRRDHGKLIFIDLRDRSGTVQMVALPSHEGAHKLAETIRSEWVVSVVGLVNKRPEKMVNAEQAMGDIEIEITALEVLAEADELPFDLDADLNLDTLLDHRPLTLRRQRDRDIFAVQATIVQAYRWALIERGFMEFQAPALVGDDAEGGANVFKVEYFNDKAAYLATSPQLYKQILVGVYERVFTTSAVFRAEKHSTTRHLNEYTSLDAEFGFISDHNDVMNLLGEVIQAVYEALKSDRAKEFKRLGAMLPKLPKAIPSMKFSEVKKLIKEKREKDTSDEPDLDPEEERWICEYAASELDSDFIFVTHYPTKKRPFYAMDDPKDPNFTKSFDLLFRGVEITTGGQRIHDLHTLVEKAKSKGLNPDDFSFYLEAFKFGMPPHGGWGMGLERLTQKFIGLDNIKEATAFPRDMNRIDRLLSNND